MAIFGKKKVRKIEVEHDNSEAREVKINIKPLVNVKEVVTLVNGQKAERVFRVEVGNRDIMTLSPREYQELFKEMLRHKDAGELIHDISEIHAEEHVKAMLGGAVVEGLRKAVKEALES